MAQLGARVVNRTEKVNGTDVTVDINLWKPLDVLDISKEEEFDQLMVFRARTRAIASAGLASSMQEIINNFSKGDVERVTTIITKNRLETRAMGLARKMRVKVWVHG